MEIEEYGRIAVAEDDHWWYRNTRAVAADLLAPWLGTNQQILDAGCGPGGNGAWLGQHGTVVGVDLSPEALEFVQARRPQLHPALASISQLPLRDASFDVAIAITVVTCVPDDRAAVRELARVVRPGGVLLLWEPAFNSLRRAHDRTVHSLHRYRRRELATMCEEAGLRVERSAYAYSFLSPPAALLGVAERLRPRDLSNAGSDVERRSLDRVFAPLAALERRVLRRRSMPIGTSALVVATRPSS